MMKFPGNRNTRAGAAAVIAALAVAGCGSASSSTTSASKPATASAPASSAKPVKASTGGVSVSTAKGPDGTYLVGASGRALYLWVADPTMKSVCSGACAKVWPPLTTSGTPVASGGVTSSDLGTIARSDGTKQVTYKGHALYYFVADHGAGMTTGQGSDSFGAKWWLVAPSGSAITAAPAKSASSGSSGSGAATASSTSTAGGGWS